MNTKNQTNPICPHCGELMQCNDEMKELIEESGVYNGASITDEVECYNCGHTCGVTIEAYVKYNYTTTK